MEIVAQTHDSQRSKVTATIIFEVVEEINNIQSVLKLYYALSYNIF